MAYMHQLKSKLYLLYNEHYFTRNSKNDIWACVNRNCNAIVDRGDEGRLAIVIDHSNSCTFSFKKMRILHKNNIIHKLMKNPFKNIDNIIKEEIEFVNRKLQFEFTLDEKDIKYLKCLQMILVSKHNNKMLDEILKNNNRLISVIKMYEEKTIDTAINEINNVVDVVENIETSSEDDSDSEGSSGSELNKYMRLVDDDDNEVQKHDDDSTDGEIQSTDDEMNSDVEAIIPTCTKYEDESDQTMNSDVDVDAAADIPTCTKSEDISDQAQTSTNDAETVEDDDVQILHEISKNKDMVKIRLSDKSHIYIEVGNSKILIEPL